MSDKTAIFGGTFDPVHNGHLMMAKYAYERFGLKRVVFLPNGNPPHKRNCFVTDAVHRYNMVKAATDGFNNFIVSDYEIAKKGYSYSLYTMRHFRKKYGKDTFFIIGADSLCSIDKWYEYETLLKENKFIVFYRSSENDGDFLRCVEKYRNFGADITIADMPKISVSSTEIRIKLSKGIYGGLPLDGKVLKYITENGLYGEQYDSQ